MNNNSLIEYRGININFIDEIYYLELNKTYQFQTCIDLMNSLLKKILQLPRRGEEDSYKRILWSKLGV